MDLLSAPEERFVRDHNREAAPQVSRNTGDVEIVRSKRFVVPAGQDFEKQYAHVYFARNLAFKKPLEKAARLKWGNDVPLTRQLLDIVPEQRCVIFGTIFKDMPLKPNILDEFHAREVRRCDTLKPVVQH